MVLHRSACNCRFIKRVCPGSLSLPTAGVRTRADACVWQDAPARQRRSLAPRLFGARMRERACRRREGGGRGEGEGERQRRSRATHPLSLSLEIVFSHGCSRGNTPFVNDTYTTSRLFHACTHPLGTRAACACAAATPCAVRGRECVCVRARSFMCVWACLCVSCVHLFAVCALYKRDHKAYPSSPSWTALRRAPGKSASVYLFMVVWWRKGRSASV